MTAKATGETEGKWRDRYPPVRLRLSPPRFESSDFAWTQNVHETVVKRVTRGGIRAVWAPARDDMPMTDYAQGLI